MAKLIIVNGRIFQETVAQLSIVNEGIFKEQEGAPNLGTITTTNNPDIASLTGLSITLGTITTTNNPDIASLTGLSGFVTPVLYQVQFSDDPYSIAPGVDAYRVQGPIDPYTVTFKT